ncbi:hypothetical protein SCLCIDRAFT_1224008 [Scleroderma citrinum Foug A]|uniref:Uncharacterized protein n=1 Tax=Scleroderma citrinum Foug A TaxID=1036808 RepID=A0A0C2YQZ1_9AGAM|nr:hypothetical protein SCLCIDRAFT_1224008 [Scleroderma citrinum Foug A]
MAYHVCITPVMHPFPIRDRKVPAQCPQELPPPYVRTPHQSGIRDGDRKNGIRDVHADR